ncbi:MAG: DNA mismatch repair protein MutS [Gemmatimonadota bacterium]|uniref:DNA mismatch repair protein MutS n=1 Tax=Candidatus Palauibacter scopulicola TaxID=3056741 RepID=UPI0023A44B48|nr:DNA mismatch repair protein MutS [Candidatus Palauibacter scopulicola]MDE2663630.1 DNA mismatch repair protein MutS [Candidatus Palauibacter scopulicola]
MMAAATPDPAGHSPLIRQYLDIKSRHPDSLLFFRVGDFYEMFFEDAEEGSGLLGLTLTARNNGGKRDVPLAGVPVKAVNEYVSRLLEMGRRVAICEQLEDPAEAKGIVKRDVVEIITPGTVLEDKLLAARRNNYVVAIAGDAPFGLAAVDLSTGEFELREVAAPDLDDELGRLEPAEIVIPEETEAPAGPWHLTERPAWRFDASLGDERLREWFGVASTTGFGLDLARDPLLLAASGALLGYLDEVRPAGLDHLRPPRVDRAGRLMYLDEMTRRNLELVEPLRPGAGASLLALVDRTRTPMGARLLRRRLLRPLVVRDEIAVRLDAVQELVERGEEREGVRAALRPIRDLERLAARVSTGRAAPRELLGLGLSLDALPGLAAALSPLEAGRLAELRSGFDPLRDVAARIEEAIDPDAPHALKDGGVIRKGFSAELDEVRGVRGGAVEFIAGMQVRERERTGIDTLKIGFNKVFGYYLEVTRSKLDRVPEEWSRRQTLTNAERYLTPELKEWEAKVLGADDEIARLEARLFHSLRDAVAAEVGRIQATAALVAEIDVLACLAEVAAAEDYVRPRLSDDVVFDIEEGRHPVVEAAVERDTFIPNDMRLDGERRTLIVTGPNMAGKSTVLRQAGLIALMAHIGSFVPARRARIGVCDRVFTRVGASDNLAAGQSTFMVEMTETATILHGATERSLVLLDEIGRGTSTYDGLSIAWAVTERLHELGARTVFATHYHELVGLAESLPRAAAFNVAVRETGQDIVFLYRLQPGGSDRSYGVHVARLAGLPPDVVGRAARILAVLESGPWGAGGRGAALAEAGLGQLSLFEAAAAGPRGGAGPSGASGESESADVAAARALFEKLAALDLDGMTPLEALNTLAEWKAFGDA